MNSIIKHVQLMNDHHLYSNVILVCDLSLSAAEQKPDTLTPLTKFQLKILLGDALFHLKRYAEAESQYQQTLQLRKYLLLKNKSASNKVSSGDNQPEIYSDVDIKYKIYQCHMCLRQFIQAKDILQTIPARLRNVKVNMALGNLLRDTGMDRSAITCYKEVLRECPLALEAVDNLLRLGIKGVEVNSLMVEMSSEINWLTLWLKAQAQLYSRDFSNALMTYRSMDSHGLLKDNVSLLVKMGYCYHSLCEDEKAMAVLQRALAINPELTTGRDLLSSILAQKNTNEHTVQLEALCCPLDTSLWSPECWVVLGNYMYVTKKYEKAAYFGQQALIFSRTNIEAYLLKARTLMELNKYQDAASHCTEALQLCSFRFDLHQCLVECYVKMNRLKEADTMALNACRQLQYSPHALTLHASVLLKDPVQSSKAVKKILEKAVGQDKTLSTGAVCMLVEFLEQEQQYGQAKQLLLEHIEHHPSSHLHQLHKYAGFNLRHKLASKPPFFCY